MKIYKFGGASVKDAEGVKNLVNVLGKIGHKNVLIIVSAMGKTTNALERVLEDYLDENTRFKESLSNVKTYHYDIVGDLFENQNHPIFNRVDVLFEALETMLNLNKSRIYDYVYDQIVGYGELISTTIISEYLKSVGYQNTWLDARDYIKTDSTYREATVEWKLTKKKISSEIDKNILNITQGFIGSDTNNFTTTLGREGSDYSAAIFAYCLDADNLTIWKDVPGVLNADPRVFQNTRLLDQISYEEAIELAFYGASVIHPKTLQPIQSKEIPLYVRSFLNPENAGTTVTKGHKIEPYIPCFIVKKDQVLLSLSSLDFSFVVEENISEIFALFHMYQIKVDLIQNSAISFSVCIDNKFKNLDKLIKHLKAKFSVTYRTQVSLYTIRHYNDQAIAALEANKEILLKQLSGDTYQIVAK